MKKCTKCLISKELTEFYKRTDGKQSHRSACKICTTSKTKEYQDSHKEQKKETSKLYYLNNKDRIDMKNKKWQEIHPEDMKKYYSTYNKKHKDRRKIARSKYCKTEKGKQISRINWNKRKALKNNNDDGTINIESLDELMVKQNNKCYYCDDDLDFSGNRATHLDHFIPLSKGGKHSINNVVWSCRDCNLRKGSKYPTTLMLI